MVKLHNILEARTKNWCPEQMALETFAKSKAFLNKPVKDWGGCHRFISAKPQATARNGKSSCSPDGWADPNGLTVALVYY